MGEVRPPGAPAIGLCQPWEDARGTLRVLSLRQEPRRGLPGVAQLCWLSGHQVLTIDFTRGFTELMDATVLHKDLTRGFTEPLDATKLHTDHRHRALQTEL